MIQSWANNCCNSKFRKNSFAFLFAVKAAKLAKPCNIKLPNDYLRDFPLYLHIGTSSRPQFAQILFVSIRVVAALPFIMVRHLEILRFVGMST